MDACKSLIVREFVKDPSVNPRKVPDYPSYTEYHGTTYKYEDDPSQQMFIAATRTEPHRRKDYMLID